jgi:twin arginine-targeting protein translocase, TatA/E family
MILGLGVPELVVILVVVLVIFGPKNLPKLGSALGKTVKNVREGMDEGDDDKLKKSDKDGETEKSEKDNEAEEVVQDEDDADVDESAPAEHVVFCPKCGTKNPAGNAFCSKCGAKLSSDNE